MIIAKESGHWYKKDGKPCYTTKSKNGKTRNTTLADARKKNLYPSVTSILQIKAKPQLEIWKQNQILMAAATLPKQEGESVDDWCKRVVADSREQARLAAEKGTEIHGAIEIYFSTGKIVPEYKKEVQVVVSELNMLDLSPVIAEKSFACDQGYAGKIDLICKDKYGIYVVVDFKSKEFKGNKLYWPEMCVQLSAYGFGVKYDVKRAINIFISTNLEEPEAKSHEWTTEEYLLGYEEFILLLKLWQIDKKYKPENA